jgi:hypothetical protein
MSIPRFASVTALLIAVSACSNSTSTFAPAGSAINATAIATSFDSWHDALAHRGLPAAGCFESTYPSTTWNRMACSTPPRLWFPVPRSRRKSGAQLNVGDGIDYTANTSPHHMSMAIGAFPIERGVTSVTSEGCCGYQGLNSYSLQLNSQFFPTRACGTLTNCLGWEQFVYSNPPGTGEGALFIQDWLVATHGSFTKCPPSAGWQDVGFGCVQNSAYGAYIPNVAATDLKKVVETGVADSSGDSVYLAVGAHEYGMKDVQSDGITDLANHWKGAEFNIIGNGGGDVADFAGRSHLAVSIQTDTGLQQAPKCKPNSGTTGETNNLVFVGAPKTAPQLEYPSIEFSMSYQSGKTPSCDRVAGT